MTRQDSPVKANRLAGQTSPYLLQHATNPVDWFPWGDEAFERAKNLDRPVFLSIGYSTCHWCHVMAHECFEDEEVAALMNETFVSVKVDREELPHIDHVYMEACQLMTGSGGWPLTVIMSPDRKPFFAATYLPKHTRGGITGMMEMIPLIAQAWQTGRAKITDSAAEITRVVRQSGVMKPGHALGGDLPAKAVGEIKSRHDPVHGGLAGAPKFPMPHHIMLLLRHHRRTGDQEALSMAIRTLEAMRLGGIYDHVGGGFHRYSTDELWHVPHFEKMLYDQALLALAYAEAYQVTARDDFRHTAEGVLDYVIRDLRTPEGMFATAEDADSEGEEGRFYQWTAGEVKEILDNKDYALARELFDIREEGANILRMPQDETDLARRIALTWQDLAWRMARIRHALFEARSQRVRPFRDDKVLTDWNGLMIAALAFCSRTFSRQDYADAARLAADGLLGRMFADGRLMHVYRSGKVRLKAGLDDHAFLIWGLIELHEATFEPRYLEAASTLQEVLVEHFLDKENGGFFSTPDDADTILSRSKASFDNAIPSGNSVAMLNLGRLSLLLGDPSQKDLAMETGRAFSQSASRIPSAHAFMMCAVDHLVGPTFEVTISGDPAHKDTADMIEALRRRFLPHVVIRLRPDQGKAVASVCTENVCLVPSGDILTVLDHVSK